jgi:hypothetical protein
MDPLALAMAAGGYVAAVIARKSADPVIEAAWEKVKSRPLRALGWPAAASAAQPQAAPDLATDPEVQRFSRQVLARSSALRRAALVAPVLRGGRVLWVDDAPGNNRSECQVLTTFGV